MEARAASHSPPLRGVAGGGQEVIAEGTVDGAEDLQVVDDAVWGQVVPQCGLHHCAGHVLSTGRRGVSDLLGLTAAQAPTAGTSQVPEAYPQKHENPD